MDGDHSLQILQRPEWRRRTIGALVYALGIVHFFTCTPPWGEFVMYEGLDRKCTILLSLLPQLRRGEGLSTMKRTNLSSYRLRTAPLRAGNRAIA